MVWTCTEERWWGYREKDADDGSASKEKTGTPKRRCMHDAMIVVEVMEEDAEDGIKWIWKIRCGEPRRK